MQLWCNSVACVSISVILCGVCSLYGFTPSHQWTEIGKKSSQHLYNEVIQMLIHTTVNCDGLWCFLPLCLNAGHKYSSFELHDIQPKTDISKSTLLSFSQLKTYYIMRWFTSWHLERTFVYLNSICCLLTTYVVC